MSDVFVVEETGSSDDVPEDGEGVSFLNGALQFDEILKVAVIVSRIPFASFHEDIDVIVGLCEVNELDNIWMLYLLSDKHLRLYSFYDVRLQL